MGSKLGWVIAGGIVAVVVLLVCWVVFLPPHSDPTSQTLKPGALDRQTDNLPITKILPAEPKGSGNAADDYKRAVAIVMDSANADLLQKTEDAVTSWMGEQPKKEPVPEGGLSLVKSVASAVAAGASKGEMNYSFDKIEVTWFVPEVEALKKVSQQLCVLAYYYQYVEKKLSEAERVTQDRFAMGWHMSRNPSYAYMNQIGLQTQDACCYQFMECYQSWPERASQAKQVDAYKQALRPVMQFFDEKQKFIFSCFAQQTNPPQPGDIFNVVENDKDPCWRFQAIFALGMLKFHGAHDRGDRMYADSLLDNTLQSGSELERAAAKAARALTREDYNGLGEKNNPPQ